MVFLIAPVVTSSTTRPPLISFGDAVRLIAELPSSEHFGRERHGKLAFFAGIRVRTTGAFALKHARRDSLRRVALHRNPLGRGEAHLLTSLDAVKRPTTAVAIVFARRVVSVPAM